MLTPMEIHNKDFKRSFRGYNEDEIDEFLDQVVNDYEKLYRENAQLKEELELKNKAIEEHRKLEQNLQDTLLMAQKTAEEVTTHARQSANEMKENAAKECQNMRRQAEIDAQRQIAEAAAKVRLIVAEYDRLVRDKNRFLKKISIMMETELAAINQTMEDLPHPEDDEKAGAILEESNKLMAGEKKDDSASDACDKAEKEEKDAPEEEENKENA